MSKIWQALKEAELRRQSVLAAASSGARATFSAEQEAALCALLDHQSVRAAAAACGLSEAALEGWLRTPTFAAVFHAACRAARARR